MSSSEMALTLLHQCTALFLLFGLGFLVQRLKIIDIGAARQLCSVVLYIVTPALFLNIFQQPFLLSDFKLVGVAFVATSIFHLFAVPLTRVFLRAQSDGTDQIKRLSVVCSNVGFVGIPLVGAILGEHGLLSAAAYIMVFNIFIWTRGIAALRGEKKIRWREVITCPPLIAIFIGVLLYIFNIRLPPILGQTIDYLAGMNTPLPTLLTGIFIAQLPLKEIVFDKRVYWPCFLRLLIFPLVAIGVFWVIGIANWAPGANQAVWVVCICAACPVAMNMILLPGKLGMDVTFGANMVAQSNLFCIVTVPLIALIARAVFQVG